MAKFDYVALDAQGKEQKGTLEVASQGDAIARLKDMGYYPTKVAPAAAKKGAKKSASKAKGGKAAKGGAKGGGGMGSKEINLPNIKIPGLGGKVKNKVLMVFTRQLATLQEAGLPLLRGLRVLEKQEKHPKLKEVVGELGVSVEGGSTFSESLTQHKRIFNKLYVNMVRAGEIGGVLELTLKRLAEFMEKAQKIKGKVTAAMFYPIAVMIVAIVILGILMVYVIPKFEEIFADMLDGESLPEFTQIVLNISYTIRENTLQVFIGVAVLVAVIIGLSKTRWGRYGLDWVKIKMPVIGPVLQKVSIGRFTRTLGTLVSSGVPILQSLTIVRETAGNEIVAKSVGAIHESVKEGESIVAPLAAKGSIFPPMVVSMVDVGEQTGALPEMLLRIADNYDEEVDNAVSAMTSLIEPIMIVFLAVIVGSIVIAMFLPLIVMIEKMGS